MTEALRATAAPLVYLISAVGFFLSLKAVAKVRLAGRTPLLLGGALALALLGAILEAGAASLPKVLGALVVGGAVGAGIASRLPASPPAARTAWIAGLGGGAAALVAADLALGGGLGPLRAGAAWLAAVLGLSSLGLGVGLSVRGPQSARATAAAALAAALGGWAVALGGFAAANAILLLGGGVAGAAALALGRIVAAASGRPLADVLLGGAKPADASGYSNVRSCGVEEAAMVLESARLVVVVPGQGMAAAGAQHNVKEMADLLERRGVKVLYAVHPSAGLVPGYMNIILDQANVPHESLIDVEAAGQKLVEEDADVVLVLGANDVVNPAAAADPQSPLFGLPILDLGKARSVLVIKRSLRSGLEAGVRNPLFEQPNTMMVFGDAKRVMQALLAELKAGGH